MNWNTGSPSPEGAPSALAEEIAAERFRLILSLTTPGVVMSTAFAAVAALYFHHRLGQPAIMAWLVLKMALAGLRVAHHRWHIHRGHGFEYAPWHRQTAWLLGLDGLVWGSGAWLMLLDPTVSAMMVSICLAGVATMAAFILQARWLYVAIFSLPALLPAVTVALLLRNPLGSFLGLALLTYAVTLLLVTRRAQHRLTEILTLRFANATLAQEREAALALAQQQVVEKSQFVATMSHELRTPLHGMLGLAHMLQSSHLDGQDRQRLDLIERSGEHLLTVINNILDFSRIEAGHLATDKTAFDLRALLQDVLALNTVTAQAKGLTLQADIQLPTPCVVQGDAARVRQILLNLVGNAVKFTSSGWVRVSAVRHPGVDQVGALVIRVADSGVGIPPHELPHIFAPFKQASTPTRARFDGTGLGLTISRAMAHAMQGEITCTSVLGQGSTFELSLPLPPAPAIQPDPATSQAPVATLGGRVMLAEDNEVNAMIVEALLRRHGLEVEHRLDGNTVIQSVCKDEVRPDLILMDCLMPSLDGFEATRLIRADERDRGLPRVPIVAITASALSEDCDRCLAAGMDGYLSKPFTEDQLMSVLARFLPSAPSTRAATPAESAFSAA